MSSSINTPKGVYTLQPDSPEISKYFNIANTPYVDIAQVLSEITIGLRHRGLTVNVNGVEYCFKEGKADNQLVIKNIVQEISDSFYILDGVLYSNISQITSTFVYYDGGSNVFILPFTPTNLIAIFVNGLKLYKASQFNIILPNQIEILQTLFNEDVIDILYEHYNNIPT